MNGPGQMAASPKLHLNVVARSQVSLGVALGGGVLCVYLLWILWPPWLEAWLIPPHMGRWFSDTYSVLIAIDVHAAGLDPRQPNPLNAFHLYPSLWLELHWFGLDRSHATLLGASLVVVFVATACWFLRPGKFGEAVYAGLFLVSPAIALGVNRANVDLLLFVILVGASAAWASDKRFRVWVVGPSLWALAVGLKFYPAVAGLAPLITIRSRRWGVISMVVGGAFLLPQLPGLYADYEAIRNMLDQSGGRMPTNFYTFGVQGFAAGVVWGYVGLALLVAGFWLGWRLEGDESIRFASMRSQTAHWVGVAIMIGCFFVGRHYAYRWVFALMGVPLWWELTRGEYRVWTKLAGGMLALTMLLVWYEGLLIGGVYVARTMGGESLVTMIVWVNANLPGILQWAWVILATSFLGGQCRRRFRFGLVFQNSP